MLIPTFRLTLNAPILQNLAVIGHFDGKHPSLAAATSTDHILIHSPHTRNTSSEHETRQFSINRQISALTSGDLEQNKDKKRDILLIGTHTNLLAYDVESNSDIFYKEVPDGVHALTFGTIPSVSTPLAIVGGNCSIQGFNATGTELFWTVTGDNVSALALRDINRDGRMQLLVGSEDFEIRIFQQEEVVVEATEVDVITGLTPIHSTCYGYALANGTIGVYNNATRVWHAKSKHKVHSINAFDLNGDGVPELVAGWSNGRIEVRHDQTGELIYKDKFTSAIAKVMVADYRLDDKITIVACAVDGEIRGYLPSESSDPAAPDSLVDTSVQENTIKALLDRKQELMAELKGFEANLKAGKTGKTGAGIIPATTKMSLTLKPNKQSQALLLTLSTNNDTVIKMAMVFSEVVFDEESKVVHPKNPATTLAIPIRPDKNVETDLLIKAVVGHKSSTQDHVFEMTHTLPRFASFVYCKPRDITLTPPKSSVVFSTTERVNRVVLWINQSFNIDEKQPISGLNLSVTSDSLHAAFLSVRDGSPLIIKMGPENGGQIQIRTDNMELAGDIVQDLCRYLSISNLESVADFPEEMEAFSAVLTKVEEHNSIRLRLSAEIADSSNLVKTLVIKAEDARILNDVPLMTRMYGQLYDLNGDLIGEYNKRANNHAELLKSLKDVNQMIQKASRLRMGDAKTKVVNACRKAIKSNNIQSLFKIIKLGNTGN